MGFSGGASPNAYFFSSEASLFFASEASWTVPRSAIVFSFV
jgi:hypothetical protein